MTDGTRASTAGVPRPGGWSQLVRGWRIQRNVIGALIMRELHTRYGRDNVGYLWMILEPMLLAIAVAMLHAGDHLHYGSDIRPVPFSLLGYTIFMIFRSLVSRAEGAISSNRPLLYHRMVTLFDLLLSRAILEVLAVTATLMILLSLAASVGLGELPVRPAWLLLGILLMTWFSLGLSMLVVAACHNNRVVEKFVHPTVYIMFPVSGGFYVLDWLPQPYQTWLSWFPMTIAFEIARYGQFRSASDEYLAVGYVVGWCLVLTYLGLLALKITRRHIHLN